MTCGQVSCDRPARKRGLCQTHYEQARRAGSIAIRPKDPDELFWSHVDKAGPLGCWLWTASKSYGGYGTVRRGGTMRGAHRVAYELLVGPIPEGMQLDHLCRVRHCVRPAHMQVITCPDNLRRGVSPPAINARKTHCANGHEFTSANTTRTATGRRCRTCDRAAGVARAAAEKAARALAVKDAVCRICGSPFTYPGTGKRRTVCSQECRTEAGRQASLDYKRRQAARTT